MVPLKKWNLTKWASLLTSLLFAGFLFSQSPSHNLKNLGGIAQAPFQGEGITIAVFDAGFKGAENQAWFQTLQEEGRILYTENIAHDSSIYTASDHGTRVLSIMAGDGGSNLVGSAPKANFMLFVTEDAYQERLIEEEHWGKAMHIADSLGAHIINSSLSYTEFDVSSENHSKKELDGKTAPISKYAVEAARRGILVVSSAGNYGNGAWGKIGFPADADSILSVGAVRVDSTVVGFSSYGNTTDGRIKPEVVALGDSCYHYAGDGSFTEGNGTSYSAPILSGFCARLMEAFPSLSTQDIRAAVISAGHRKLEPDSLYGHGIPNFYEAFDLLASIRSNLVLDFGMYPNPVVAGSVLNFSLRDAGNFECSFFDLMGKRVNTPVMQSTGYGQWQVEIPNTLASGMYRVQMVKDGSVKGNALLHVRNF